MLSGRERREVVRSAFGTLLDGSARDEGVSDQVKGVAPPPVEKPCEEGAEIIELPAPGEAALQDGDIRRCMAGRRSRRTFSDAALSLESLSFLLWATQGVDELVGEGYASFRPVPSGGARHAFETYVAANRVDGLAPGVFRYLPVEHQLVFEYGQDGLAGSLSAAACGQDFVGDGAAVFVWTAVPYRCEWRYPLEAAKLMLLDAGHVCQNLYLGCEALGLSTCAIAAYDQDAMDRLVRVDGEEEFVVYLAPVGHGG